MLKGLFQLFVIVLIGVLIYNYFLGSPEEKATSKEIFTKAGDLGKAAFNLLRSEKEKFEQGKYDEAVSQVGGLINSLRSQAQENKDGAAIRSIDDLERRRKSIEAQVTELEKLRQSGDRLAAKARETQIRDDWQQLLKATESVLNKMEVEAPAR